MFDRIVIRISAVVQAIERWLLSASILAIAALTIIYVLARAVFRLLALIAERTPLLDETSTLLLVARDVYRGLAFTDELSQFLIIIVCFVGLSYAASQGRHIRMTAIYDQLSLKKRKTLMIFITGSTSAIMLALGIWAIQYVLTVHQLGGVYPALRVPFYVVYLAAPLGLLLASVQYALALIKNLTSDDVYLSFTHKDEYEQPVTQEI